MKLSTVILMCLISFPLISQKKHAAKTDDSSVKEPALKWKFNIRQPFIASPIIDNNTVFVGGLDSTLYALDSNSGEVRWKFKTQGQIRSATTISNNNLYLVGGDGLIYCVDKSSGKKIWSFATLGGILGERRYDAADYFNASPTIHDDKIYVGAGDGRFYALNASTGSLIWSFKADDIIHTSAVVARGKVFFGSSDGYVYSLETQTGNMIWKFKAVGHRNFPKGEMQGSPVISGNLLFIGSRDYNLYAIDILGGYCHWNKQFPLGWATALTANDSALYVGTSDDKVMLAIDPRSGRELWKLGTRFNIFGPPTIQGGNVYVGTQMGKIFEVNRKTGNVGWVYTTTGYQTNRLKYFKEDDTFRDDIFSRIKGFNSYVAMLYSLGAIYSTPAVTEELVVFSTTEGIIYCLKK